jgi:predicted transposase YdaD
MKQPVHHEGPEGGSTGEREGEKEGRREGGRKEGREGWREGGREGKKPTSVDQSRLVKEDEGFHDGPGEVLVQRELLPRPVR